MVLAEGNSLAADGRDHIIGIAVRRRHRQSTSEPHSASPDTIIMQLDCIEKLGPCYVQRVIVPRLLPFVHARFRDPWPFSEEYLDGVAIEVSLCTRPYAITCK